MSYAFPKEALRAAIKSAIRPQATQHGKIPPEVRFVYAPQRHVQALDPNTMVVEGIRGAGKSFWWATLLSQAHRQALTKLSPQSRWLDDLEVTAGFGAGLIQLFCPHHSNGAASSGSLGRTGIGR